MKKLTISSVVAAAGLLLAYGSGAYGQTVDVDRIQGPSAPNQPDYGGNTVTGISSAVPTDDGGEFTVIPSVTSLLNNYVLGTTAPTTQTGTRVTDPGDNPSVDADSGLAGDVGFQTFCLELGTPLTPIPTGNVPYTISPTVLNGGTKALTVGVAYLYSQFAQGILSGYDYVDYETNSSGNPSIRGNDAAYLQAAIWYLQADVGGGYNATAFSDVDGASNVYLQDLITAGLLASNGLTGTALGAASADQYGVEVLNLGNAADNYDEQALLVYQKSSVPDGGTTVALLGVALGGIEYLRRKLAA